MFKSCAIGFALLALTLSDLAAEQERFTVAAVGDIMLGSDYPEPRLPPNDGAGFLTVVAPVLKEANLAMGNLEGTLLAGGEPRKVCASVAACYLFRSPPRYANLLASAGIDLVSLANNHSRDFGEAGRSHTMAVLDRAGIRHSGRRGDIATWSQFGKRWAFIAFSPTLKSYLLNDIPTAREIVADLSAHHDLVLVSFHGGAEGKDAYRLPFAEEFYFGETRGEVVRFARAMVDAGAALVVGHGPHVVRPMELYKGHLIAYSLGNFATYEGISIDGPRGFAPLLVATIDAGGQLIGGRIHSALQQRPGGLVWDPEQNAFTMLRGLTEETFGSSMFRFGADGSFEPAP